MPDYLSKEEIKQWRSSLEKITLEEYAARLGKVLEEEKQTNDLIDIVLKNQPVVTRIDDYNTSSNNEKLNAIGERAFSREKEIANNSTNKTKKISEKKKKVEESIKANTSNESSVKETVKLTFAKALTEREQMVFDYFMQNKGKIVYAKDLANLLSLPRDYVYKYIKNLRTKIEGDKLQNAENCGYVLNI